MLIIKNKKMLENEINENEALSIARVIFSAFFDHIANIGKMVFANKLK